VTASGTAALYLILEGLKKISPRKTVVVPSFVCPLLPLAIHRAGLKVSVCDINRRDFGFDPGLLEDILSPGADILAVVAVHLAGIPTDMDAVLKIARRHGVVVIEDCAQSLGAARGGAWAGTLGDVSFFSLCRGKGVTTYEGGVIATANDEYARRIDEAVREKCGGDFLSEVFQLLLLPGYGIFYRPSLFWFVFKLPYLYWTWRGDGVKAAMEDFTIGFPLHRMSRARQNIGHRQFSRLKEAIRRQRGKAAYYIERLKTMRGITVIEEPPDSSATYPFVTIIFDDADKRGAALKALDKTGTGASFIYALAVCDYDYLRPILGPPAPDDNFKNARHMAGHSLTLSTSVFIGQGDMDGALLAIESALR
jgi:dTDP-4-amino-4,6-dideoxygalactose transaminase